MKRPWLLLCVVLLAMACSKPGPGTGDDDDDTTSPTPTAPPPGSITYYEDILPIVQDECSVCHTTGGVGPGAWDEYASASSSAALLANVVEARIMPPWPPEEACGQPYDGERLLTDDERLTFRWWSDDGAPEGDPASAPTPPPPPDPNHGLGVPDVVMDPGAVTPNFNGALDLYWCLRLNPNMGTSDFIAAEILPSNRAVVHHALLYREPDGITGQMGAPGFECGGIPGQSTEMIAGWTPGDRPLIFPPDIGMTINATDALLLQIHYHVPAPGTPTQDNTIVKMWFAQQPVSQKAHVVWTGNPIITIPNGAVDQAITGTCTVPSGAGATLLRIGPHMHNIGTKFNATVTRNGVDSCLVDIARWDFNWQGTYQFTTPVDLPPGSVIRTTCTYTNNTGATVGFGEGSNDEMCFGFLTVVGNLNQYCFF